MDITVGVRMDTVISLRRRVETGEVIDDEHAGRRGGLGRGELRDARVQISNARIGRGAVRREDLGEEQRCLRLRLAHGVDELAELVERAIETLALENVVRTEVNEHDVRLILFGPAVDIAENLVDAPAPMSFVIVVEIVVWRWTTVVDAETPDEIDVVALGSKALPERSPVSVVVRVALSDGVAERHDAHERRRGGVGGGCGRRGLWSRRGRLRPLTGRQEQG